MEEKILLLLAMIYIALLIASMLKFEQISVKNLFFSIFMPIMMIIFCVDFIRYILNTDFKNFSVKEKIPRILKLVIFEIQCFPIIHTKVVSLIKDTVAENAKNHSIVAIFKVSPSKFPLQKLRNELNPLLEN